MLNDSPMTPFPSNAPLSICTCLAPNTPSVVDIINMHFQCCDKDYDSCFPFSDTNDSKVMFCFEIWVCDKHFRIRKQFMGQYEVIFMHYNEDKMYRRYISISIS